MGESGPLTGEWLLENWMEKRKINWLHGWVNCEWNQSLSDEGKGWGEGMGGIGAEEYYSLKSNLNF